jgi:NAD(P)-dependent dehydrogenase (short-subunit alcohol dehydrogenase family)
VGGSNTKNVLGAICFVHPPVSPVLGGREMLTVQLAAELRNTGIKVNSADPGFTATDLNAHRGRLTIPDGAAAAVRLALLPDDGPPGGFFSASHPEPW